MAKVSDEASWVGAEEGDVIVEGPGGVSITFTPEAAMTTSDRLLAAAAEAHGQRLLAKQPPRDRNDPSEPI